MNILIAFSERKNENEIKKILKKLKKITNDKKLKIKRIPLNGLYFLEPIIKFETDDNYRYYKNITTENIESVLNDFLSKKFKNKNIVLRSEEKIYFQDKIILNKFGENIRSFKSYISQKGYWLTRNLKITKDKMLSIVTNSELRERDNEGEFFYKRLETLFVGSDKEKVVVCNLLDDYYKEKNKVIIDSNPHGLLEGVLLASYIIDATQAVLLVDMEDKKIIETLQKAIAELIENKIIGKNSLTNIKLSIRPVLNSIIFSDKSSLYSFLNIDDKTNKIYFDIEFSDKTKDKPILISDAETFVNLAVILKGGTEEFQKCGTKNSYGTKLITLFGNIENKGVFEAEYGISIKEIINKYGKGSLSDIKAVQLGGIFGKVLSAKYFNTNYDYDYLQKINAYVGDGSIFVLGKDVCAVDYAKYLAGIFLEECCGRCTIGRIGIKRVYEILKRITEGQSDFEEFRLLKKLLSQMNLMAKCSFGKRLTLPILSLIKNFEKEFIEHIDKGICPTLQCHSLIKYHIDNEKCKDCSECVDICPANAILKNKREYFIDQKKCIKCDMCYLVCKIGAIKKLSKGMKND